MIITRLCIVHFFGIFFSEKKVKFFFICGRYFLSQCVSCIYVIGRRKTDLKEAFRFFKISV